MTTNPPQGRGQWPHDDPQPSEASALDRATGDGHATAPADAIGEWMPLTPEESAAALAHVAMTPVSAMPTGLRDRLAASGRSAVQRPAGMTAAPMSGGAPASPKPPPQSKSGVSGQIESGGTPGGRQWSVGWLAAAAGVALLVGGGWYAWSAVASREQQLATMRAELEQARARIQENDRVLQSARDAAMALEGQLASSQTELKTEREKLAAANRANLESATRLAQVTSELDRAKLTIAQFEAPADPAELQQIRRKLLDIAGTIRMEWEPFDLPDQPAELRNIAGDVVWNDDMQTGYLRFVGLKVNDPKTEQYQVWVIDERGMEQKVSGGVFNATAQGEVIVPIKPGIDVGRVALFAITIEKPGGTWVPDLSRRVVVAPRGG